MSHLPNRVAAFVVAGVVIVALVTVVVVSTSSTSTFDLGTPERTVQAYLQAALERDSETAAAFIADDSPCDAEDLDRAFVEEGARVELTDTTIDGNRSRVEVTVTIPSGGPFPSFWDENHSFRLTRTGEEWLLNGIPWPLFDCEGSQK